MTEDEVLELRLELACEEAEAKLDELGQPREVDVDTQQAEEKIEDVKDKINEISDSPPELDLDTGKAEDKLDELAEKAKAKLDAGLAAGVAAAAKAFEKISDAQSKYEEDEAKRYGQTRSWGDRAWSYTKTLGANVVAGVGAGAAAGVAFGGVGAVPGAIIGGIGGLTLGAGKVGAQIYKDINNDEKFYYKQNEQIMKQSAKKRKEEEKDKEKAAREQAKAAEKAAKEKEKDEKQAAREAAKAAKEKEKDEKQAAEQKKREAKDEERNLKIWLKREADALKQRIKASEDMAKDVRAAQRASISSRGSSGYYMSSVEAQAASSSGGSVEDIYRVTQDQLSQLKQMNEYLKGNGATWQ